MKMVERAVRRSRYCWRLPQTLNVKSVWRSFSSVLVGSKLISSPLEAKDLQRIASRCMGWILIARLSSFSTGWHCLEYFLTATNPTRLRRCRHESFCSCQGYRAELSCSSPEPKSATFVCVLLQIATSTWQAVSRRKIARTVFTVLSDYDSGSFQVTRGLKEILICYMSHGIHSCKYETSSYTLSAWGKHSKTRQAALPCNLLFRLA